MNFNLKNKTKKQKFKRFYIWEQRQGTKKVLVETLPYKQTQEGKDCCQKAGTSTAQKTPALKVGTTGTTGCERSYSKKFKHDSKGKKDPDSLPM